jgi:hypothetical protein
MREAGYRRSQGKKGRRSALRTAPLSDDAVEDRLAAQGVVIARPQIHTLQEPRRTRV